MTARPTVTVVIPVLNEAEHLPACLDAIGGQTYGNVCEVLVVDGGSTDGTPDIARRWANVRVVANPRRIQAAALNIALNQAKGELFVRVDGHCVIAPDYVERCVDALESTGAAMVGGAMTPVADGWQQRAIAMAMSSRIGAGPARFHTGGPPGWVDTVYLGAFRTPAGRAAGGYAESVGVNEDAELAIRMRRHGGIWFDPSIRSTYVPRDNIVRLARQFYRYGRSRAATVRKHPSSISPRQLLPPTLVLGLLSPWRRGVARAYTAFVVGASLASGRRDVGSAPGLLAVLPAMHLAWGMGFLRGMLLPEHPSP